jgi:hypothetical protein
VVALGAGNTHNLVARGHFSLAHIKLDKNNRGAPDSDFYYSAGYLEKIRPDYPASGRIRYWIFYQFEYLTHNIYL